MCFLSDHDVANNLPDPGQACTSLKSRLPRGNKARNRLFEKLMTCMKSGPIRWRAYLPRFPTVSQVIFFSPSLAGSSQTQFPTQENMKKQTCLAPIVCFAACLQTGWQPAKMLAAAQVARITPDKNRHML